MKNRPIIEKIALKADLPEAQIELIESQLWLAVKYYLSNPLLAKQGILLNKFIKYEPPSIKTIEWYLKVRSEEISEEEIEFYNNYLKILKDGKPGFDN